MTVELGGVDLVGELDPSEVISGEVAVETAIVFLRQLRPIKLRSWRCVSSPVSPCPKPPPS